MPALPVIGILGALACLTVVSTQLYGCQERLIAAGAGEATTAIQGAIMRDQAAETTRQAQLRQQAEHRESAARTRQSLSHAAYAQTRTALETARTRLQEQEITHAAEMKKATQEEPWQCPDPDEWVRLSACQSPW